MLKIVTTPIKTKIQKIMERQPTPDKDKVPKPSDIMNKVASDPDFNAVRHELLAGQRFSELSDEERGRINSEAVSTIAMKQVAELTHPSGYRDRETNVMALLADMDDFATGQAYLDKSRESGGRSSGGDFAHSLESVIKFNHDLRAMIDHDGATLTPDSLSTYLTQLYHMKHSGKSDTRYFKQKVEQAVTGMQHEVFFEQLVGEIGFDYDTASDMTEEKALDMERRGVDIIVYLPDETKLEIDVKSSQNGVDRAYDKRPWVPGDRFVVASPIQPGDSSNFRLKKEVAEMRAQELEPTLLACARASRQVA